MNSLLTLVGKHLRQRIVQHLLTGGFTMKVKMRVSRLDTVDVPRKDSLPKRNVMLVSVGEFLIRFTLFWNK